MYFWNEHRNVIQVYRKKENCDGLINTQPTVQNIHKILSFIRKCPAA